MVYDDTYALGQIFQAFLRDQSDVLDDLCASLCGEEAVSMGSSDELLGCFEQWLDEGERVMDKVYRTRLMQIAEAFVDLAAEFDNAASVHLV